MQILSLLGIRYLYSQNIFLYIMFSVTGLAALFMFVRGPNHWKRRKVEDAYAM